MITIKYTIKINRPVEDVFSYATNRANLARWFVGVYDAVQKEPNGVGTRATVTAQMLGLKFSFTSEIAAYEPNRTFAVKGDKPFPLLESETFTQQGDFTRLDYHGVFHTSGLLSLIDPLISWLFKRQLVASFRKLKEVLEADQAIIYA